MSWIRDASSPLLREFADSRRRVVSDWRILVVARRLAQAANAPLPSASRARGLRIELERTGGLAPVDGAPGVYVVNVPYANLLEVSEEQIIQEANPWAVFGFLTAMVGHGLTDILPADVHAIRFTGGQHLSRVPLGTMPEDWDGDVPRPPPKCPARVSGNRVVWTEMAGNRAFGVMIGYSAGLPIYMTDVERTLIDALRMPEKCGGIAKTLQAWRDAEGLDPDRLVAYTDEYGIQVLRQRVGYLMETLGMSHPRLDDWRAGSRRGGSMKLLASGGHLDAYSAEWNLSLNVPRSVLAIIE